MSLKEIKQIEEMIEVVNTSNTVDELSLIGEQACCSSDSIQKMLEKYKVLHSIVCEQDTEDLENAFLVNWLRGDIKIPSIVKDRLLYEDERYKKMYEENKRLLEENAELDRHIQELEYNATR